MSEWKRVATTTIADYIRKRELNIMKDQKILAMLKSKGRIIFNCSGKKLNWKVKKKRNTLEGYADMQDISAGRVNRDEEAELPVRGYVLGEAVSRKEQVMNKGKEAIVNFVTNLVDDMMDDAEFDFNGRFFVDGNATGNENDIHGFPSWLGYTGSAQYTLPSDVYGGLVTNLGNYGGAAISGTWPIGRFDPEYYFWAPTIVNYTHADWSASTDNWANNCLEALSAGIIHSRSLKGRQGAMDLIVTTPEMYREFLDQARTKENLQIQRREDSGMVALGFRDVVNWDGVDVTSEADVPDGEAYGLAFKTLELRSWQKQLFKQDDDFDITNLTKKWAISFFGNLKGNPRATTFWKNIT